jgi:hypothetical protein
MPFNALHGAVDDAIVSPVQAVRKDLISAVRLFCHQALGLA